MKLASILTALCFLLCLCPSAFADTDTPHITLKLKPGQRVTINVPNGDVELTIDAAPSPAPVVTVTSHVEPSVEFAAPSYVPVPAYSSRAPVSSEELRSVSPKAEQPKKAATVCPYCHHTLSKTAKLKAASISVSSGISLPCSAQPPLPAYIGYGVGTSDSNNVYPAKSAGSSSVSVSPASSLAGTPNHCPANSTAQSSAQRR